MAVVLRAPKLDIPRGYDIPVGEGGPITLSFIEHLVLFIRSQGILLLVVAIIQLASDVLKSQKEWKPQKAQYPLFQLAGGTTETPSSSRTENSSRMRSYPYDDSEPLQRESLEKKTTSADDDEDEGGDGEDEIRGRTVSPKEKNSRLSLPLACPFYKRDPSMYAKGACSGPGWPSIVRVKYETKSIKKMLCSLLADNGIQRTYLSQTSYVEDMSEVPYDVRPNRTAVVAP